MKFKQFILATVLFSSLGYAQNNPGTVPPTGGDEPQNTFINHSSRCKRESLNGPQAKGRIAWAKRCDPIYNNVLSVIGNTTTQGGTKYYPIYAVINASGALTNPLNWTPPKSAGADCIIPTGYRIVALCIGGCFTPEQKLSFIGGEVSILEAKKENLKDIISLENLTENKVLTVGKVKEYIESIEKGVLRRADVLKVGGELMNENLEAEKIISIKKSKFFGKVYNLFMEKNKREGGFLVADGLLSGDASYQNEKAHMLNRTIFRDIVANSL
jgi:hypothetical protein